MSKRRRRVHENPKAIRDVLFNESPVLIAARGVSRGPGSQREESPEGRSLAPRELERARDQALGRGRPAEPSAGGVSQIPSE
jgi:hypothetical protein